MSPGQVWIHSSAILKPGTAWVTRRERNHHRMVTKGGAVQHQAPSPHLLNGPDEFLDVYQVARHRKSRLHYSMHTVASGGEIRSGGGDHGDW